MRTLKVAALICTLGFVAGCGNSEATSAPTPGRSPGASAATASATATARPTTAPSPVAAHWELAGTMGIAIADRHALLLGDGRVLVVGTDRDTPAPRAVLWDPSTSAWAATESLPKSRRLFVAVRLNDGRALVTGGLNEAEQSYSSTYIYDPRPGHETWSKSGLLGTARTAATAAVLPDGRVLVAGGYFHVKPSFGLGGDPRIVLAGYHPGSSGGHASEPPVADIDPPNVGAALATAELFDPATGEWSPTGALRYARVGAAAVTLADGRILIVGNGSGMGGVTVDGHAADTAEIYDPKTRRFSLAGTLPAIDRAALERQGTKGANPVPDDTPDTADVGSLVALDDGGAVLIGWAGWWKHAGEITRSFRFDPRSGRWSEIGQTYIFVGEPKEIGLTTAGVRSLAGAMVAGLPDGRVLVAGGLGANLYATTGYNEVYTAATTELYDPTSDTWSALPPLPEARADGAAVVLQDGSVLVTGGSIQQSEGVVTQTSAVRFVPER